VNNDIEKHKNSEQKVTLVRCRSLHVILFALADNPYAVKEVDKAEDFDVNRSAENYSQRVLILRLMVWCSV